LNCKKGADRVLYVELLKTLYGTLRAARLSWERLSQQWVARGLTLNPLCSCVANTTISWEQGTMVCHVKYLKFSYIETLMVDCFIRDLEKEFGKETPLSKSRGKLHDYLHIIYIT
jgi:hypothetical protein